MVAVVVAVTVVVAAPEAAGMEAVDLAMEATEGVAAKVEVGMAGAALAVVERVMVEEWVVAGVEVDVVVVGRVAGGPGEGGRAQEGVLVGVGLEAVV